MLETLPEASTWYFFIVLPIFLLVRSRNLFTALGPNDPRIMENLLRLLRVRARVFQVWAAFSVVLIVGTLWVGVMLFGKTEPRVFQGVLDKETGKEVHYKLEITEDSNALLSAMSHRIGAIVIMIFLVTVLVHMYRDNMKQATFYDRWADAFQLAGTNLDELKRYTELLFLEWLELDKPPKSPVGQIAQALRGIQTQLGKHKE